MSASAILCEAAKASSFGFPTTKLSNVNLGSRGAPNSLGYEDCWFERISKVDFHWLSVLLIVLAVPGTTLPPLGLTTNFIILILSRYFLDSVFILSE